MGKINLNTSARGRERRKKRKNYKDLMIAFGGTVYTYILDFIVLQFWKMRNGIWWKIYKNEGKMLRAQEGRREFVKFSLNRKKVPENDKGIRMSHKTHYPFSKKFTLLSNREKTLCYSIYRQTAHRLRQWIP